MPLKLTLKPRERLYTGRSFIYVESDNIEKLYVEGPLPIMREKDYLDPQAADTDAKKLYVALQRSYLEDDFDLYKDEYLRLSGAIMASAPGTIPFLSHINEELSRQNIYRALKAARKLIQFDEGMIVDGSNSAKFTGF
jgi:flagellar protein FlbT